MFQIIQADISTGNNEKVPKAFAPVIKIIIADAKKAAAETIAPGSLLRGMLSRAAPASCRIPKTKSADSPSPTA